MTFLRTTLHEDYLSSRTFTRLLSTWNGINFGFWLLVILHERKYLIMWLFWGLHVLCAKNKDYNFWYSASWHNSRIIVMIDQFSDWCYLWSHIDLLWHFWGHHKCAKMRIYFQGWYIEAMCYHENFHQQLVCGQVICCDCNQIW